MGSPENIRLSTTTKLVLEALLAEESLYGLEVCRATGLATGTVHPILARLERARWVTSAWESVDPSAVGRPARRYYRLTPEGAQAATRALASSTHRRPGERAALARAWA